MKNLITMLLISCGTLENACQLMCGVVTFRCGGMVRINGDVSTIAKKKLLFEMLRSLI